MLLHSAGASNQGALPTVVVGGPDDVGQGRLLPTTSVDQYASHAGQLVRRERHRAAAGDAEYWQLHIAECGVCVGAVVAERPDMAGICCKKHLVAVSIDWSVLVGHWSCFGYGALFFQKATNEHGDGSVCGIKSRCCFGGFLVAVAVGSQGAILR